MGYYQMEPNDPVLLAIQAVEGEKAERTLSQLVERVASVMRNELYRDGDVENALAALRYAMKEAGQPPVTVREDVQV